MNNKNKLIEILQDTLHEWECDVSIKTLTEITEHLIANGVIVPPCNVGDIVFTSYDHIFGMQTNEILTCRVVFIGFGENGNYINIVDNYGHMHSMSFEEFDKTVFFTRKEAEKALKQSKNNVNGE